MQERFSRKFGTYVTTVKVGFSVVVALVAALTYAEGK